MQRRTLAAAFGLVLSATLIGVPVGSVAANHEVTANFTVVPIADYDHKPGIDDASYLSFTVGDPTGGREGFEYLAYSVLEWDAGTLGHCGPSNIQKAGIDRGDDAPGTQTDESVIDNIEGQPVSNQDRMVVDFDDPGGSFGEEPVHLNVTDQFITHMSDCRGNPDQPGWYQITGTVNGTTWSGRSAEYTTTSHYFYICNCKSYDEAEKKLGLPPSRQGESTRTGSPTPTATASMTQTRAPPDHGTPFPSPTPTATVSGNATSGSTGLTATNSRSATDQSGSTAAISGQSTQPATPTPAAWAANTPASGPGFGVGAALVASLGALLVLRRRM